MYHTQHKFIAQFQNSSETATSVKLLTLFELSLFFLPGLRFCRIDPRTCAAVSHELRHVEKNLKLQRVANLIVLPQKCFI